MLRNLKITNCLSFFEETELSFQVTNKAPDTKKYQKSAIEGERLSKVIGIVGANASGKSNFLRVIKFLKWFLTESFGKKPDAELPIWPFILKESPYEPSDIEVEFEYESTLYKYRVLVSRSRVLNETLEILDLNRPDKERKRFKTLFSREYNSEIQEYALKSNPEFGLSDGVKEITKKRKNASLISAAIFSNHEPSLILKKYWSNVVAEIKQFGEENSTIESLVLRSSEFYQKNQHFKVSAQEIMAKCDLGLVSIDIERVLIPKQHASDNEDRELFVPYGKHIGVEGKEFKLPFPWESSGTQRIFVLLSTLLPVLASGGLAVIDELEADLHPALLPALMDLFISPQSNPKGAQLIFTCHATPLLNFMDKYQVLIVSKNKEGVSSAVRLDALDGVRNDDNFYAKYMAGAYGGIPHPGKLISGVN